LLFDFVNLRLHLSQAFFPFLLDAVGNHSLVFHDKVQFVVDSLNDASFLFSFLSESEQHVSHRNDEGTDHGLSESLKDIIVHLALESGTEERIIWQGNFELKKGVDGRVRTWSRRLCSDVIQGGSLIRRHQTLQVEDDESLLHRQDTHRLQVSQSQHIQCDSEVFESDLILEVHIVERSLVSEIVSHHREGNQNFSLIWSSRLQFATMPLGSGGLLVLILLFIIFHKGSVLNRDEAS